MLFPRACISGSLQGRLFAANTSADGITLIQSMHSAVCVFVAPDPLQEDAIPWLWRSAKFRERLSRQRGDAHVHASRLHAPLSISARILSVGLFTGRYTANFVVGMIF